MTKIFPAKEYNADPDNTAFPCMTGKKKRETGYITVEDDGERRWFPNIQQAKTHAKDPSLWPERGEVIYIP